MNSRYPPAPLDDRLALPTTEEPKATGFPSMYSEGDAVPAPGCKETKTPPAGTVPFTRTSRKPLCPSRICNPRAAKSTSGLRVMLTLAISLPLLPEGGWIASNPISYRPAAAGATTMPDCGTIALTDMAEELTTEPGPAGVPG